MSEASGPSNSSSSSSSNEDKYERLKKKLARSEHARTMMMMTEEGGGRGGGGDDFEQLVELISQSDNNIRVMDPNDLLQYLAILIYTYVGFYRRINISRQVLSSSSSSSSTSTSTSTSSSSSTSSANINLMSIGNLFETYLVKNEINDDSNDDMKIKTTTRTNTTRIINTNEYHLKLALPLGVVTDRKNLYQMDKHMNHPFLLTHKFQWELLEECMVRPKMAERPRVRRDAPGSLPQPIWAGVIMQHSYKTAIAYLIYCTKDGLFYNHTKRFTESLINPTTSSSSSSSSDNAHNNNNTEDNENNTETNNGVKEDVAKVYQSVCLIGSLKNNNHQVIWVWSQGKYVYALTNRPAVYQIQLYNKEFLKKRLNSTSGSELEGDELIPYAEIVWQANGDPIAVAFQECIGAYFDREIQRLFVVSKNGFLFYSKDPSDTSVNESLTLIRLSNSIRPKESITKLDIDAFFYDEINQSFIILSENSLLKMACDEKLNLVPLSEFKRYELRELFPNFPHGVGQMLYLYDACSLVMLSRLSPSSPLLYQLDVFPCTSFKY